MARILSSVAIDARRCFTINYRYFAGGGGARVLLRELVSVKRITPNARVLLFRKFVYVLHYIEYNVHQYTYILVTRDDRVTRFRTNYNEDVSKVLYIYILKTARTRLQFQNRRSERKPCSTTNCINIINVFHRGGIGDQI